MGFADCSKKNYSFSLHGLLGYSQEQYVERKVVVSTYEETKVFSIAQDIVIPRNICSQKFATIVWDNNDFSEETSTGRGTSHVLNGILILGGT